MRKLAKKLTQKITKKARNASKVRVIENFSAVQGTAEEKIEVVSQLLHSLSPKKEWEIDEVEGPIYSMTIVHPEGWLAIEIQ